VIGAQLVLDGDLRIEIDVAKVAEEVFHAAGDVRVDVVVGRPLAEVAVVEEEVVAIGDRIADRDARAQRGLVAIAEEAVRVGEELAPHAFAEQIAGGAVDGGLRRILGELAGKPEIGAQPEIGNESRGLDIVLHVERAGGRPGPEDVLPAQTVIPLDPGIADLNVLDGFVADVEARLGVVMGIPLLGQIPAQPVALHVAVAVLIVVAVEVEVGMEVPVLALHGIGPAVRLRHVLRQVVPQLIGGLLLRILMDAHVEARKLQLLDMVFERLWAYLSMVVLRSSMKAL